MTPQVSFIYSKSWKEANLKLSNFLVATSSSTTSTVPTRTTSTSSSQSAQSSHLTQSTQSTRTSQTSQPTQSTQINQLANPSAGGSTLSGGAIAGIVLGAVAVTLFAVILARQFFPRWFNKRKANDVYGHPEQYWLRPQPDRLDMVRELEAHNPNNVHEMGSSNLKNSSTFHRGVSLRWGIPNDQDSECATMPVINLISRFLNMSFMKCISTTWNIFGTFPCSSDRGHVEWAWWVVHLSWYNFK